MPTQTPWYQTPAALKIIARLIKNPPVRQRNTSSNDLLSNAGYMGYDVIALRALFKQTATRVLNAQPYNADAAKALLDTSADEVLAGLFGCPDGLDWAHPDRAARRTAIAAEITEALARKEAA